jgi:hypothetical protein
MNMWLRFWIYWALLTFGFWLYYPAYGQTVTGNLVNPAGTAWGIPSAQVLNSAGILAVEGGGTFVPGSPYYNSDFNTIRFSYTLGTVAQSIAINSALAGTGVKWLGYDYSWQVQNAPGQSGGTLYGTVSLNGNNGKALESFTYNYPQGITPASTFLTDSGRQLFSQSGGYTIGQVSSLDIAWTGQDSLFWMGLYGPRVRNTDIRLLYGADQCATNPLSDPTCPGYQTAMCTSNPLSSTLCPGYTAAYLQQQCTISALYDPSCPGYTTAYVTQQMTQTPTATASTSATSTTTVSVTGTVSTTEPTITIATDGTVTTTVATVPETEVNTVVTRKIESTASPTGTVTLQVQTKPQEESEEERRRRLRAATDAEREIAMKEEKKREEEASERRRELAAKMRAAAQESAIGRGREAIRDASRAENMEQQVANQALIVATMNFVPGFESYGVARLPDAPGYRPYEIYRGQQPVDNRRLLRGLTGASDQRHADMVNSQYGR